MMKRISEIRIKNYRAYNDEITIKLPKGENLLIYGENGSGKSSLYKGLNTFIQSYVSNVDYEKNRYNAINDGYIQVDFKEYDKTSNDFVGPEVRELSFRDGANNSVVEDTVFLKAAALTRGFLDYKDLLRVYLYDDNNLFDLIVLNVLKNHIIGSRQIISIWSGIVTDFWNAKRRTKKSHESVFERIKEFKVQLKTLLDNITPEINNFLTNYFEGFNVSISFNLTKLNCSDEGKRSDWKIETELYLKVNANGEEVINYVDFLNEARLSAISICIFLAALKTNESKYYKILFLDDVFVGLDASNRLPILKILKDHFSDYQIILTTYDRQWFHMAERVLSIDMSGYWISYYLYAGLKNVEGPINQILRPIVVKGETNLEKAIGYLHHRIKPDYLAAANYFRKSLEEKLMLNFPPQEFTKNELDMLDNYELTERLNRARFFLQNIQSTYSGLDELKPYLHILLHPMSHYNVEEQIYKAELLDVERILTEMDNALEKIKKTFVLIIEKGTKLILKYNNVDSTYKCCYKLNVVDNVYLYRSDTGELSITNAKCQAIYAEEDDNGIIKKSSISRNDNSYCSILDARDSIYSYLNLKENRKVVKTAGLEGINIIIGEDNRKLADYAIELSTILPA